MDFTLISIVGIISFIMGVCVGLFVGIDILQVEAESDKDYSRK